MQVNYQVIWQQAQGGIRFTWIRWNGSAGNRLGYCGIDSVSGDVTGNTGSAIVGLDNGQFFEVWCYQTSSQSITIGQGTGGADTGYANRIQITRLNP